jgi:DNA-binding response OmpR family regulator
MPATVLIVDDDPYILMPLEFLMRKQGYNVFIARNGTEALALVASQTPDLILLDIMMPDVNGYDICTHIKSTPHLSTIKVVFMSAKTTPEDIARGYELGAAMYIPKPFSTRELVRQVKAVLA